MIPRPASDRMPDACILPATRITLSPSSGAMAARDSVIALFWTPIPGFPVKTSISAPMAAAVFAFCRLALRPFVKLQMSSSEPAEKDCSAGSKLTATKRPVKRLISRMVSFGSTFGRPQIWGSITSNMFRMTTSAPMAQTNSALVMFPNIGCTAPIVSHASMRPSLMAIDFKIWSLFMVSRSVVLQSKSRFNMLNSS